MITPNFLRRKSVKKENKTEPLWYKDHNEKPKMIVILNKLREKEKAYLIEEQLVEVALFDSKRLQQRPKNPFLNPRERRRMQGSDFKSPWKKI